MSIRLTVDLRNDPQRHILDPSVLLISFYFLYIICKLEMFHAYHRIWHGQHYRALEDEKEVEVEGAEDKEWEKENEEEEEEEE